MRSLPVSATAIRPPASMARARGRAQLPRAAAGRADRAHEAAGGALEDGDPAAALVEHEGVAGGVEGDGDGARQERRAGRRRAPDGGDRAVRVEQLDAAVDRVGDGADAGAVGGDAHRGVELAGRAARGAEAAHQAPAAVEDLDAVVAGVGDVDQPARVDGDPARVGELAGGRPEVPAARLVGVVRRRAEAHDAVVEVVGDEQAPGGVDGDVVGVRELAGARPGPGADGAQEAPAGVEHDEAVVAVVGDGDARAAHGQAQRRVEPPGRHDDLPAAAHRRQREALDAVVAGVGDVDVAAADGDPAARAGVVAAARAEAELAGALGPAAPEGGQRRAVGAEAQDPVRAVGDEQRAVARDGDAADRGQLARPRAGLADLAHELAGRVEHLDGVRGLVADVDEPVGADRHRLGEAQDALAALADLGGGAVRAGGRRARAVGRGGGGDEQDGQRRGEGDAQAGGEEA